MIPKKHWPKVRFREKRAITPEEHQAILDHEPNPDRKAFYQLCWLLGASQSDVAFLEADNVDWPARVISLARKKTKTVSMVHFGDEVEAVLRTLPAAGPFFPKLRKLNSARSSRFPGPSPRSAIKGSALKQRGPPCLTGAPR